MTISTVSNSNVPASPSDIATEQVKNCMRTRAEQFANYEGPAKATFTFTVATFFREEHSLNDAGRQKLDEVVKAANCMDNYSIIIIGHSAPNSAEGMWKSERRAIFAKDYLVNQGLEDHRIYAEGVSNRHPVILTEKPGGYDENRRVEIKLVGTPKKQ